MKFFRASAVLTLIGCSFAAHAVQNQPGTARTPVLLELFTSEGCSSCPPADDWVRKLDEAQPVGGAELIVLSEHVDYWDHDGWKDPYSSGLATARQGSYAHELGLETYTPQIIVNGTDELRLSKPDRIKQVFRQQAAAQRIPVSITSAEIEGGSSQVVRSHIQTGTNAASKGADVFAAIALGHAESQVMRGENGGKRLTHVAVLRSLKKIGTVKPGEVFSRDFAEKLESGTDAQNVRLIVFVQEPGPGKVIGAALHRFTPETARLADRAGERAAQPMAAK